VEDIKSVGRKAIAVKTDLYSRKDIKSLIEESIKTFGKIDILANNAGVAEGADLVHSDEDERDNVLSLNLKGAFIACKAAVP
jgi:3-oxoacyl-[acyl-carrier protein] reductase